MSRHAVLLEVPQSPSNIQESQEEEPEEWVAVEGGGFVRDDGTHNLSHSFYKTTFSKPHSKPCKTIRKRTKKVSLEYFENHCENTKCTFPPGHTGLCSHQIVHGKRGRGSTSGPVLQPAVVFDMSWFFDPTFDLNDDDSD